MTNWRTMVNGSLSRVHNSKQDKRPMLSEAIKEFVRPGMKLNPVALQARPNAATYEICRQFAGKDPGFEVIASSIGNTSLSLVHLGLVRKAVVSYAGESYPTPGPSRVVRRAFEKGNFAIENWSMLSVSQRLMAGAMGVPFFATRSLAGSSIGQEAAARGEFMEATGPNGEPIHLLKAYRPDISFVHAWAADREGNAIVFPPYAENVYGALAAREGVIVTADHIVDSDVIRQYAPLVRIPASVVRAVCHVPYGSHPSGNFAKGIDRFVAYGNDYDFMAECRAAQKTEESFDQWVREWILDLKDHAAYVKKLGQSRVYHLHFVAQADSWRPELEDFAEDLDQDRPASPVERMIVQGAREVARRATAFGYRTCLAGVGYTTLMSWLATHELRKKGRELTMMAETGIFGHDPRPADPFVFNYRNLHSTTVLTDIFETLGLHTGGAANRCIGTFGAGELDKHGNVNSTRGTDGSFLVGSGGANDIASAASETVVAAHQRLQTFVEKVSYITSPGRHIQCVVSTMGRFEKRGSDELMLTGYFPEEGMSEAESVQAIKDRCGWALKVAESLEKLAAPTSEELTLLRLFDPHRHFLGKPADVPQTVHAK